MEAFEGYETRVQYEIVGHSGESYNIPFVDPKKPPADDKQRLATIKVSRIEFEIHSFHIIIVDSFFFDICFR